MHFHLPKPLHGWRELIGEVGIIVVGVLIALAAEQVVEGFHERSLRNEARTAIDDEISQNMDAFRRRAEVQQCINARLRDVETLITTSPLGASLPRPLWIGRPQVWAVNNSRLTAATSGAEPRYCLPSSRAITLRCIAAFAISIRPKTSSNWLGLA